MIENYLKGRGSQINPHNRFNQKYYGESFEELVDDENPTIKTKILKTHSKSIVNEVKSPDISMMYSMNPYQGCEHGCTYCYARNTHQYWGYSAGIDFESIIFVKENAAELLEKKLKSKNWQAAPIMLSGNTDCYQPVEKRFGITRQILKVFWKYRHPVGIISKNSLMLRDIDLLHKLNKHKLLKVSVSLNTLNDQLRQKLEPRASSIKNRLKLINHLSAAGIYVNVMCAPMIPGLNTHEIPDLLHKITELGAKDANYITLRLNGEVAIIFKDWLSKNYPDRANKIINHVSNTHGGKLSDSRFKIRMKGEGKISEMLNQQFKLIKKKLGLGGTKFEYNLDLYDQFKSDQMKLF